MKSFTWKLVICLLPILLGALVVARAFSQYQAGEGGFNLGVDLVGGTILVYEVDQSRWPDGAIPADYSVEKLTAKLKQRIDPADLYNVRITPLSKTRVEIVLPTGGRMYAQRQEAIWQALLDEVKKEWPPEKDHEDDYAVGLDQRQALIEAVTKYGPPAKPHAEDVEKFINTEGRKLAWKDFVAQVKEKWPPEKGHESAYDDVPPDDRPALIRAVREHGQARHPDAGAVNEFITKHLPHQDKRRQMSGEKVQEVKELISRVGSLKFVILANTDDDKEAIDAAKAYFDSLQDPNKADERKKLTDDAVIGKPPPPPGDGKEFVTDLGKYTYSWIELGPEERHAYGLDNASEKISPFWKDMEEARASHKAVQHGGGTYRTNLFYSRDVQNPNRLPEKDRGKKYEYFILCRDPERDPEDLNKSKAVTGEDLINAYQTEDRRGGLAVGFTFNNRGAGLLADLTTKNKGRQMAIVLDDFIQSAPNIEEPITGGSGIIRGKFKKEDIDRMVNILRSGALPATLKSEPVSENTMGATLGADTIFWGSVSVVVAFVAILAFMLLYYRFAGVVACVALFANLLLTVALMVLINATFTLPGLAGLVLMLGMAVDANVLIYERLREERERGASLALAIRNGYDRAFPTIIDTHLSSIFTAVVLYVVGNDQLKGFGISLTLGLIISLFTSLYMTRLMFDFCLAKGWLKKLSFFGGLVRVLHARYWDFMSIRYYWFTATIILTLLGASVFIFRLDKGGLNIDFMGGTKYSGLLREGEGAEKYGMTVTELRGALNLDIKENKEKVAVADVRPPDEKGYYKITYADGETRTVFVDKHPDGTRPSEDEVRRRAQELPDLTVEQLFSRTYSEGDRSRRFSVKTQEKSRDLVEAMINRLLGEKLQRTEMTYTYEDGKNVRLKFSTFASPAQVQMLLERQFKKPASGLEKQANQFTIVRVGKGEEGRYKDMRLVLTSTGAPDRDALDKALGAVQKELKERPQPESLENFDAQLAADTQLRALYAILASWGAILLYLWFRFGNWTFGLAAVLCLIHDLFFTLGFIGIAHFIHLWWPNNFLGVQDFKIDLQSVAALLTLVGYSVNDTIVVFDRIREVRGKNPELTPKMINDGVNQTLSRTLLTALSVWLVVIVLYVIGGEGVHLFAFVMVVGVVVGTYSSIYIASPLLLIFGEGRPQAAGQRQVVPAQAQT